MRLVPIIPILLLLGCQTEPNPPEPPPDPAPPPGLSLSVDPLRVPSGGSVTVSWAAPGADSVSLQPGNITGLPSTGSQTFTIDRSQTFVLTAVYGSQTHQTSSRVTISR